MASKPGAGRCAFAPITHLLIGWIVATVGPTDRATRKWCLLASVIPDLDGLGLVLSVEHYHRYHHLLGHNILCLALVVALSGRAVGWAPLSLFRVGLSFALHVVGDYFGSGPGWPVYIWYPFSRSALLFPHAWPLNAWPNVLVTVLAGAYTLRMGARRGITPVEFLHSGVEQQLVDRLGLGSRTPCAVCSGSAPADSPGAPRPRTARTRCRDCRRPLCPAHSASPGWFHTLCTPEAACPNPESAP